MSGWREAYEQLQPDQQDRVQRWIHLNRFIAHTLALSFDAWIDGYVRPAMEKPLDYSFMAAILGDFRGLVVEGKGVSFTREMDPAVRLVSRVPLRAKNNLGRLSPEVQDRLGAMLEGAEAGPVKLPAGDVALLQKIFPRQKSLAKLPKPAFKKLILAREEDDIVLALEGSKEDLARVNVLEFAAVMGRPLV